MKPCNFPARKLQRQIAAISELTTLTAEQQVDLQNARQERTKKNRTKVQPLPDKPKRGKRR